MNKKIVVALGGNAILADDPSAEAQRESLRYTSKRLVKLIKQGYQLIITHGNGPQVGNLLLQQKAGDSLANPALPLDTCVAMTQGSIGYWLQNALREAMKAENIEKDVVSIVTQVLVDAEDDAFANPTKPIGPFLTEEEAAFYRMADNSTYMEDAGRGWRKVVPSPKPIHIIESPVVDGLVEKGIITISAGGGGIPVIETPEGYQGVEAVIDKDFTAAKLAELVNADYLIILTGVDNVYVNYNKPNQKKLERVKTSEMQQHILDHQFANGSMLPKIEAVIQFLENTKNGKAVITSLANIDKVFSEEGSFTLVEN